MMGYKGQLNRERSMMCSGVIRNRNSIIALKEEDYYVKNLTLDGDAPKQFIKAYFFENNSTVRRSSRSSWIPFIAKTAEKWYPHESIIEFMINRIGEELGLVMNQSRLVYANGQIRFLSRFFLSKNERLVHGAEICGEHLNDFDFAKQIADNKDSAREFFTFEFITSALEAVYPKDHTVLLADLVRMIVFDGIVGNNDRHFYNWGVIDNFKKSAKKPRFAPVFDSARGLLWNTSDEGVVKHLNNFANGGKKIVHYVEKAAPRISVEAKKDANHFQLITHIRESHTVFRDIIKEFCCVEKQERVFKMLKTDFYPFFIPERIKLIEIILEMRFKRIREVIC